MTKILRIDEFVQVNKPKFTTTTTDDVYKKQEGNKGFKIIKNAVKDVDGNWYDGIEINGKAWMASNLRTTRFNDGSPIGRFADSDNGNFPYFEYPNVEKSRLKDYGLYYNFEAISAGNLAPEGWHVPSKREWTDLFTYIACQKIYNLTPDNENPFEAGIAKSLCSKEGWRNFGNVSVGNNRERNNTTGFNILPSGIFSIDDTTRDYVGECAYFGSSDVNAEDDDYAWCAYVWYNYYGMKWATDNMLDGISVRCVRDY